MARQDAGDVGTWSRKRALEVVRIFEAHFRRAGRLVKLQKRGLTPRERDAVIAEERRDNLEAAADSAHWAARDGLAAGDPAAGGVENLGRATRRLVEKGARAVLLDVYAEAMARQERQAAARVLDLLRDLDGLPASLPETGSMDLSPSRAGAPTALPPPGVWPLHPRRPPARYRRRAGLA